MYIYRPVFHGYTIPKRELFYGSMHRNLNVSRPIKRSFPLPTGSNQIWILAVPVQVQNPAFLQKPPMIQ